MEMLFAFISGMFAMLGFILYRMMTNDGWDDSNITNALRLLSHVTLHAEDFGKMVYIMDEERFNYFIGTAVILRPFWYVDKDELSEVVRTRP
jgi:hypothetical protein